MRGKGSSRAYFRSFIYLGLKHLDKRRHSSFIPPVKTLKHLISRDSPTDVTLVLSHAQVSLHVVPRVPQLGGGKVADSALERLGPCETKSVSS